MLAIIYRNPNPPVHDKPRVWARLAAVSAGREYYADYDKGETLVFVVDENQPKAS